MRFVDLPLSSPAKIRDLTFEEWGRGRVVSLDLAEARILSNHKDALRCDAVGPDRYRIGPVPGFVGSIRLSARTTLVVTPRLPIDSFAALLSLAYDEMPIPARSDKASVSQGDLSSWCISQIVAEAQRLCRHHLRPDYVEVEDRRTSPRGKLIFDGLSPDYRGGIRCRTDDFTYDTELNRFIKAGLLQISKCSVAAPWRPAISRLLADLNSITAVLPTTFSPRRLSSALFARYRPLATLINLALMNQGSEFDTGALDVSAFFFRLHELFERAVYNAFRRVTAASLAISQPQDRTTATLVRGSPHLGITFKPDVAIKQPTVGIKSSKGAWLLVVDAKYRDPIAAGRFRASFRNDNIYQIMAYCRVFNAPGLLLYPRVDQDVDISYKIGDTRFSIRTIDLQCNNLAEEFERRAREALSECRS
jgi:5-methylcytosine-specific restriction endonuclease McrBC regulatory subunit McrC